MANETEHPRLNETQTDVDIENLAKKIGEMDKYLNTLGAENTDLKERVVKLEKLHPEA